MKSYGKYLYEKRKHNFGTEPMMKLKFQHLSFPSHLFDNCLYSDPAWKTSAQYRAGHRITGPLQGKLTCVEFGFMGILGQSTHNVMNVMHDLSSFLERISPNCPNYSAIQGLILASKIHPGQWEAVAVQLHALNQNTWRYIASRFITWHYIHIYVVSSIAISLRPTIFFKSRQVYDFPARTPLNFYAMWSVWYFGWWETTSPQNWYVLEIR